MWRRHGLIGARLPIVLAPMAGITNTAFRTLCREAGRTGSTSAR